MRIHKILARSWFILIRAGVTADLVQRRDASDVAVKTSHVADYAFIVVGPTKIGPPWPFFGESKLNVTVPDRLKNLTLPIKGISLI